MTSKPNMLINLPPPPSDPTTPNEQGPGTPNSTTTSLSALSVVATKDGAVGHRERGPPSSINTLEAERADRISRLAGLERVATVRSTPSGHLVPGGGPAGPPQYAREISTVGSASATGSVGGKTTWASQSMGMDYDEDKMSEDQDDGLSSVGAFTGNEDDKDSLVGFGEGAGSTISGPVSTANARLVAQTARNTLNNPTTPRGQQPVTSAGSASGGSTPMSGVERPSATSAAGSTDPKMMDGISYDQGVVDTTVSTPPLVDQGQGGSGRFSGVGAQVADNIIGDRLTDGNMQGMMTPPNEEALGKFGFERD